jgi:nitroreductase
MRRSVRNFTSKQVEKEKIEQLLEAARYAPTAGNGQPVKWMIIHNSNELKKLTEILIEFIKQMAKTNPDIAQRYNFQILADAWDKGNNLIFRQAPHLVIAFVSKKAMMPLIDSAIALTHFELALPTFGLGGTWAGFFYLIAQFYPELPKILGLPDEHQITGGIMFGYPKFEYHRVPKRNKQTVLWK